MSLLNEFGEDGVLMKQLFGWVQIWKQNRSFSKKFYLNFKFGAPRKFLCTKTFRCLCFKDEKLYMSMVWTIKTTKKVFCQIVKSSEKLPRWLFFSGEDLISSMFNGTLTKEA